MTKVYKVFYPHKYVTKDNEEKSELVRVGTAFRLKDADGFNLELSVPLALSEGSRLVVLAKEDETNTRTTNQRTQRR